MDAAFVREGFQEKDGWRAIEDDTLLQAAKNGSLKRLIAAGDLYSPDGLFNEKGPYVPKARNEDEGPLPR